MTPKNLNFKPNEKSLTFKKLFHIAKSFCKKYVKRREFYQKVY